jgi:hypothetical protein
MTSPTSPPKSGLDFRLILETPLRFFIPWLAAVLLVAWAGYPGVICVTPMAWLMALAVGQRCASHSTSPTGSKQLLEAALAGALFGLLQGVLFFIIAPRMGPVTASEQTSALGISLGMLCVGIPVAASLSTFTAWLVLQRTGANKE